jgi:hypothetical protein
MKWKIALLVLVALCSSVVFVSAQTAVGQRATSPNQPGPYVVSEPGFGPGGPSYTINSVYNISGSHSHEEMTLTNQASQLAQQLGAAKSDTDRDKLKTQLGTILEKQFELRQERHRKEIESLEAQVKKLRDLVDKRQENRREIIAKRLDQILQESQGLGW